MIIDLDRLDQALATTDATTEVGRVEQVIGLVIETQGPTAKMGDLCYLFSDNPQEAPLPAEVVGFKAGRLQLMPLER